MVHAALAHYLAHKEEFDSRMDVHCSVCAVTRQLRIRGVDLLTAQDDETTELSDPDFWTEPLN